MSREVMLIALTALLYMMGLSVIFPVLPEFSRALGLSDFSAGVLAGSYAFASFVASPLWGAFSERHGRKPAIQIGLLGFSVAFMLFGLGETFTELLAARILGGLVAAATLPAIFAYAADASASDRRNAAMGAVGAGVGVGILFGTALGGFLSGFDLRLPFFATAALGGLTLVGVTFALPESLTPEIRERDEKHRRALAKAGLTRTRIFSALSPMLLLSFLVQSSRTALESGVVGFLLIDRFGGDARDTAFVMAVGTIAAVLMQGGGVRALARRFDDRTLLLIGLTILMLGLFGIAWVTTTPGVFAMAIVFGIGGGLFEPTFRAELSRAGERVQGEAQGLNASAQSLARALGPPLFTYLYVYTDATWTFGFAGLLCALGIALGLRRPEPTLLASPKPEAL